MSSKNLSNIARPSVVVAVVLALLLLSPHTHAQKHDPDVKPKPAATAIIAIDLDHATQVKLPAIAMELKPVAFKTADGKVGWVVRVPGGQEIATPAYADGMIFVGGGQSSNQYYAFNADTGELIWKASTGDSGPTAAAVDGGYVTFNTVSCTIVVLDEKTGKMLWQQWLGEPLYSQPAIANSRLFMAFPAGQRPPNEFDTKETIASAAKLVDSHRLLAMDIKTGKHLWIQGLSSDVISAPVISGNTLYITCFDGTSYAMDATTGKILWKKTGSATSAPVISNGQMVVAAKTKNGNSNYEGLARIDVRDGKSKDENLLALNKADYLGSAGHNNYNYNVDGLVDARRSTAVNTIEVTSNVRSIATLGAMLAPTFGWAYQGSRASYFNGQIMNAQGRYVNSIKESDGQSIWRAEATSAKINDHMQVFSPPSLGKDYMYLSSILGQLVSVRQKDGAVGFDYSFNTPMVFQPALVNGNVYVGGGQGLVICLKTGGQDADGWYSWGGNAQHNKN